MKFSRLFLVAFGLITFTFINSLVLAEDNFGVLMEPDGESGTLSLKWVPDDTMAQQLNETQPPAQPTTQPPPPEQSPPTTPPTTPPTVKRRRDNRLKRDNHLKNEKDNESEKWKDDKYKKDNFNLLILITCKGLGYYDSKFTNYDQKEYKYKWQHSWWNSWHGKDNSNDGYYDSDEYYGKDKPYSDGYYNKDKPYDDGYYSEHKPYSYRSYRKRDNHLSEESKPYDSYKGDYKDDGKKWKMADKYKDWDKNMFQCTIFVFAIDKPDYREKKSFNILDMY